MTDPELLRRAADEHGTPIYVYDADAVAASARAIRNGLKSAAPVKVYYSAKANPAVGIASLMRSLGMGLDACSEGDLRLAELAGFKPSEISYTGFGLTEKELTAVSPESALILDSLADVRLAVELKLDRPIGLRVNPGISAGFHAHVMAGAPEAKFGLAPEEIVEALSRAEAAGLAVEGLHCHLGSDVRDAALHIRALDALAEVAERVPTARWVNIGGGFGTPRGLGDTPYSWEDLARHASVRLQLDDGRRPELRLEPGSHCLMDAGVLVGRVLSVKESTSGRPRTIVTDANTNHLVSVLLYDANHPPLLLGEQTGPDTPCSVAGNLMQAGDVLARDVLLPPVSRGDLIVFPHAGAYASGRSTSFNERPPAAEALVTAESVRLLRRHGSTADLFARDLTE